jgi:hypothetical protein
MVGVVRDQDQDQQESAEKTKSFHVFIMSRDGTFAHRPKGRGNPVQRDECLPAPRGEGAINLVPSPRGAGRRCTKGG